jgi:hypothetical protein
MMLHYFNIVENIWCTNIICIDLFFIEELPYVYSYGLQKRISWNYLTCELECGVNIEKPPIFPAIELHQQWEKLQLL